MKAHSIFLILLNKIKNSKEIKNAGWLISGRLIQMVLSFFVNIYTARYLGPGNYGLINYIGAYVAFFTSFCTLGINAVIIKDFVDNPDEEGTAIGTTILLRFFSSVLSALMIVGIVFVVDKGDLELFYISILCSIALIFQIFDTINYWFQSRYKSRVTAVASLIAYLIVSIYKIILLIYKKSIFWFAFANSIDYIVIALVLIFVYRKHNGPKLIVSIKKAKELLGSSYHYILSGMMVAIYGQTDKLMLKHMLDNKSVGYYSLATSINLMWVFVLGAIIDSMYPTILKLYNSSEEEFNRKNRQLYAIIIYVSVFVAIVFIVFGKLFITILYGEEYYGAVNPLKIIVWYTIFSYLGVARNAWIVCKKKQKYLKYMYFSAAILNVLLNLLFIPKYDASGAAMASLITQVFTSILFPWLVKDLRENVYLMIDAFLLKKLK